MAAPNAVRIALGLGCLALVAGCVVDPDGPHRPASGSGGSGGDGSGGSGGTGGMGGGAGGAGGGAGGAGGTGGEVIRPLRLDAVTPSVIDPLGGSTIVVQGEGLSLVTEVLIAGVSAQSFLADSDTSLRVVPAACAPGEALPVEVVRGAERATLPAALSCWSPAVLPGARLFDAGEGVETGAAATRYEWQRLTPELHPDWRVRDGNTLTWLPSTGRYWMVAGWNGYREPDGFSHDDPDVTYPPQNTTDEVWSSADGIEWRLELPHGNGSFERRHSHNTMLWNDALWMIGGDAHQGFYNHDVVSSPDGVTWTVQLGPGTTEPPWSERALQVSGVYDGKLWMVGGQDILGPPSDYVFHNDVWNTADGVNWTLVAPDGPASATRWAGCGVLDGLVEFRGRMWLVGCAREREDATGHSMSNEVWSTTDGVVWTLHAEPPWVGKIWPNVFVWDDRLWIGFGYTYGDPANGWTAGNSNELWYSDDGETWSSLPVDSPQPGSHAQGVAVREDQLLYAGGNYGFGFGLGVDKSVWRLVPMRGAELHGWTARGDAALRVAPPTPENRPLLVADAFGAGRAGVQLDGSSAFLALPDGTTEQHAAGLSVLWIARAPYSPPAWGWAQNYGPASTIVGGAIDGGYPRSQVGYTDGRLVATSRATGVDELGSPIFVPVTAGEALQEGPGEVHLAGVTHAADGAVQLWLDGRPVGAAASVPFDTAPAWSRIGAGIDGGGEGPWNRFAGTLGAVIVLPGAADAATVAKLHEWAQGRFGVRRDRVGDE